MQPQSILLVWLVLFLLEQGWEALLSLLNLRHARANAELIPPALSGVIDPATRARAVSYTLARGRLGLLASLWSAAVLLAIVLSGSLGAIDDLVTRLPVGRYLQGVAFVAAISVLFWLTGLPFVLYATFALEARFGFNRTTPRLFIIDTLKSALLSLAIGVPVLLGLFWCMERAGAWWWLWAFLALTAFELVLNLLWPLVVAPWFNRFTPLAEGALRERILELAGRLGFRTRGIFVMDGSRRSQHSNAYFTGLGRAKRVVLFDTLVKTMDEEQVLAVIAHEIGHARLHHVRRQLLVSIALGLLTFWVLSLLVPWEPLYRAFGFSRSSTHAILVLLGFCSGPFMSCLRPLVSWWSRRREHAADRFAVDGTGGAAGMRSALLRLTRENLANVTPHPWYSFYHYTHPTVVERIAAIEEHAAARGLPTDGPRPAAGPQPADGPRTAGQPPAGGPRPADP